MRIDVETSAAVRAAPVPSDAGGNRWRGRLRRAVVATDVILVLTIVATTAVLGVLWRQWGATDAALGGTAVVALAGVLMAAMHCWDPQVLGQGAEEFNRLARAFVRATLLLAFVGFVVKGDALRPWVVGVLPVVGVAVLVGRWLVRRVLHRARREGACMARVLVVGTPESVADLVTRTERVPWHGWRVVAACTPAGEGTAAVPVVGDLDDVTRQVAEHAVDVVAVAPAPGWTAKRLHRLAWDLEGTGVDLVVDPGLMEVGGPRLHVAPVDGLPMLRLTEPRFSGTSRVVKAVVDRVGAAALLLLLAPALVLIAVLVGRDGGPVFYRQERVGLHGRTFRMVKFRSMVVDADRQVPRELNEGAGPLFKMRRDPRVTPVGAVLRRLSLDELPQLFNVLGGTMSLVGPRPPLAREVEHYADDARRRLLVRPGMTGLWQVSGRSDLSWEESVRLDLRYVENWSPALDATILWKTVGAVLGSRGAY
ncbi:sugar transferase [Actinomycetospora corticicola]|uniref:Exopolysaccharide biosynthesis polyprenyl glycosylphosphotransferase n=1 Tax=Actinomycetospora corticicola TaxID=663602 RepID=A0A7Y9J408_9PSEU|nr:sugar transferase [Actinomycetospora corticicola]NYD34401.1 exopolysaccharide biosynthesis polyprenyl glycosylphosphotransferase [Actinomycetospora corticicola]